jgi:hypothetical protein
MFFPNLHIADFYYSELGYDSNTSETILGMGGRRIKGNDGGGEFNYDIL